MSQVEVTRFSPTESWHGYEPDEAIEKALQEMNQKNPGELIDNLQRQVESSQGGVAYAILKGEKPEEYSSTEALVMFNPFANAATPNMLMRTEFLREVAKFSDVRDSDGKLKPVVMLASPGINGSKVKLSRQEKKEVKKGDLGPVARELLQAVSEKEIGQVALLGFSQGADVALAGARTAYSANLDTSAVSVGDPAGVKARSMPRLMKDFNAAAPDLEAAADRTGLIPLKPARLGQGEYRRFAMSAAQPINWLVIGRALGAHSFEGRVQELFDEGRVDKLVVGYGEKSTIAPPAAIEPSLQRLHERDVHEILTSIKVEDAQHTWGDQLTLLAKLYMRALK
jgi:hypothetical protein